MGGIPVVCIREQVGALWEGTDCGEVCPGLWMKAQAIAVPEQGER